MGLYPCQQLPEQLTQDSSKGLAYIMSDLCKDASNQGNMVLRLCVALASGCIDGKATQSDGSSVTARDAWHGYSTG